jgi:hypothetical protein
VPARFVDRSERKATVSSMRDETAERTELKGSVLRALRMLSDDAVPDIRLAGFETIRSLGPSAIPDLVDALPDYGAANALRVVFRDKAIYALLRLSRAAEATPDDQKNAAPKKGWGWGYLDRTSARCESARTSLAF